MVSAEYDAIHDAVIADPESVWDRARVFLCGPADADMERIDIVEDLMWWHSDAFIDRLEALVEECPEARHHVEQAHVGGVGVGQGLERFYDLQARLRTTPTG